ncbi:hypothetical protein PROFUN_17104, partial [Planoprotostelium fungivorum]
LKWKLRGEPSRCLKPWPAFNSILLFTFEEGLSKISGSSRLTVVLALGFVKSDLRAGKKPLANYPRSARTLTNVLQRITKQNTGDEHSTAVCTHTTACHSTLTTHRGCVNKGYDESCHNANLTKKREHGAKREIPKTRIFCLFPNYINVMRQGWRSTMSLNQHNMCNTYLVYTPIESLSVFQKCVEQYDDPDAKYEQYKIIPYSGLRNSAYEKELNAGVVPIVRHKPKSQPAVVTLLYHSTGSKDLSWHTTFSHYKQSNSVTSTSWDEDYTYLRISES